MERDRGRIGEAEMILVIIINASSTFYSRHMHNAIQHVKMGHYGRIIQKPWGLTI